MQGNVDPATKLVTKLLNAREAAWAVIQKKKMTERIEEKLKKASNVNNTKMKLMKDCKSWNGPVTLSEELIKVLKSRSDQEKFILRTELTYFTHTYKTNKAPRSELYRQNLISQEEKLENLCILLTDDAEQSSATIANLPTYENGMKALSTTPSSENALSVRTARKLTSFVSHYGWRKIIRYNGMWFTLKR